MDCTKRAKPKKRSDVGTVAYYITDFGESSHFEDMTTPHLVTGDFAQDKDVPELSEEIPYDPFPVDVFTLGMVYKRNFLNVGQYTRPYASYFSPFS